jgi:hypothetical protein
MALGLAAVVSAAGLWIGGIRAAKDQQAAQRPLCRIQLPLDRPADWRTATFTPRRRGIHAVVLESSNPDVSPSRGLFGGAIEIEIRNAYGRVVFQRVIDGQAIEHPVPSGIVATEAALFDVPEADGGVWAMTARVARGDKRFAQSLSSVYVGSPVKLTIGMRIFGVMLGAGTLLIAGGLLLAGGGWLARREHLKKGGALPKAK